MKTFMIELVFVCLSSVSTLLTKIQGGVIIIIKVWNLFGFQWSGNMQELYTDSTYGCYKGNVNPDYYTAIIQMNNYHY